MKLKAISNDLLHYCNHHHLALPTNIMENINEITLKDALERASYSDQHQDFQFTDYYKGLQSLLSMYSFHKGQIKAVKSGYQRVFFYHHTQARFILPLLTLTKDEHNHTVTDYCKLIAQQLLWYQKQNVLASTLETIQARLSISSMEINQKEQSVKSGNDKGDHNQDADIIIKINNLIDTFSAEQSAIKNIHIWCKIISYAYQLSTDAKQYQNYTCQIVSNIFWSMHQNINIQALIWHEGLLIWQDHQKKQSTALTIEEANWAIPHVIHDALTMHESEASSVNHQAIIRCRELLLSWFYTNAGSDYISGSLKTSSSQDETMLRNITARALKLTNQEIRTIGACIANALAHMKPSHPHQDSFWEQWYQTALLSQEVTTEHEWSLLAKNSALSVVVKHIIDKKQPPVQSTALYSLLKNSLNSSSRHHCIQSLMQLNDAIQWTVPQMAALLNTLNVDQWYIHAYILEKLISKGQATCYKGSFWHNCAKVSIKSTHKGTSWDKYEVLFKRLETVFENHIPVTNISTPIKPQSQLHKQPKETSTIEELINAWNKSLPLSLNQIALITPALRLNKPKKFLSPKLAMSKNPPSSIIQQEQWHYGKIHLDILKCMMDPDHIFSQINKALMKFWSNETYLSWSEQSKQHCLALMLKTVTVPKSSKQVFGGLEKLSFMACILLTNHSDFLKTYEQIFNFLMFPRRELTDCQKKHLAQDIFMICLERDYQYYIYLCMEYECIHVQEEREFVIEQQDWVQCSSNLEITSFMHWLATMNFNKKLKKSFPFIVSILSCYKDYLDLNQLLWFTCSIKNAELFGVLLSLGANPNHRMILTKTFGQLPNCLPQESKLILSIADILQNLSTTDQSHFNKQLKSPIEKYYGRAAMSPYDHFIRKLQRCRHRIMDMSDFDNNEAIEEEQRSLSERTERFLDFMKGHMGIDTTHNACMDRLKEWLTLSKPGTSLNTYDKACEYMALPMYQVTQFVHNDPITKQKWYKLYHFIMMYNDKLLEANGILETYHLPRRYEEAITNLIDKKIILPEGMCQEIMTELHAPRSLQKNYQRSLETINALAQSECAKWPPEVAEMDLIKQLMIHIRGIKINCNAYTLAIIAGIGMDSKAMSDWVSHQEPSQSCEVHHQNRLVLSLNDYWLMIYFERTTLLDNALMYHGNKQDMDIFLEWAYYCEKNQSIQHLWHYIRETYDSKDQKIWIESLIKKSITHRYLPYVLSNLASMDLISTADWITDKQKIDVLMNPSLWQDEPQAKYWLESLRRYDYNKQSKEDTNNICQHILVILPIVAKAYSEQNKQFNEEVLLLFKELLDTYPELTTMKNQQQLLLADYGVMHVGKHAWKQLLSLINHKQPDWTQYSMFSGRTISGQSLASWLADQLNPVSLSPTLS